MPMRLESSRASTARWFGDGAWSFAESATRRSVSVRPDHGEIVPTAVVEAIAAVRPAETEVVLPADGPALRVAADRLTDRLVEAPAEIATGREWSERTLPPEWWMGGSDCGRDV